MVDMKGSSEIIWELEDGRTNIDADVIGAFLDRIGEDNNGET